MSATFRDPTTKLMVPGSDIRAVATALASALDNLLADVMNLGSHSVKSRPSVVQARALMRKLEGDA